MYVRSPHIHFVYISMVSSYRLSVFKITWVISFSLEIHFKSAVLVLRVLHSLAPVFDIISIFLHCPKNQVMRTSLFIPLTVCSTGNNLRSASSGQLLIPTYQKDVWCFRALSHASPHLLIHNRQPSETRLLFHFTNNWRHILSSYLQF